MLPIRMPLDYWRSALLLGTIMAEAQLVIGMRLMGSFGAWNLGPREHLRMVTEKADAVREAGQAATAAFWRGKDAGATTLAALKQVRKRTRNNVRRLSRRGPVAKTRPV